MSTFNIIYKIAMIYVVAIFFVSCAPGNNDRNELIETFNFLNERIHEGKFDVLINDMDSMSAAYLADITNPQNHNLASVKEIGDRYKLRITSLLYFYQMGNHPDDIRRELNFFRFLSLNEYSWFDNDRLFWLYEKKIKRGTRNYVPIRVKYPDHSKLYWIAFRKNKADEFTFDLMYSLILMESRFKRRYEPAIKSMVPDISNDAILDALWSQWKLEPFQPYDFNEYDFNRRTRFPRKEEELEKQWEEFF